MLVRRYAHVQLSAWTSSTEKTVMAASDVPSALPELSSEASNAAATKGFQQITGWQVKTPAASVLMSRNEVSCQSTEEVGCSSLQGLQVHSSVAGELFPHSMQGSEKQGVPLTSPGEVDCICVIHCAQHIPKCKVECCMFEREAPVGSPEDCMYFIVQIYDLLLEAALEAQQCGLKRLELTGAWQWLLTEFGETYGIRSTYARLAHLRWIVRCWHMPHHECRVCRHNGCCYGMVAGILFKTDGYQGCCSANLGLMRYLAPCRKENVSLTAYCLSLLEKDMEQLKGVQAACALLPMACPLSRPSLSAQHSASAMQKRMKMFSP